MIRATTTADAAVAALGRSASSSSTDERPTRVVVSRSDGCHVDLHLRRADARPGRRSSFPADGRFTYFLDGTTGVIDGRSVRCLSPEMQLLTHAGYEPDDDDRADVALVADDLRARAAPAVCIAAAGRRGGAVREATVADVPGGVHACACDPGVPLTRDSCRKRSSTAIDLGTMWSAWRASVAPSAVAVDAALHRRTAR